MSQWVGYAVSLRCGSPLGCYQGTVAAVDGDTLTLTKVFRNGFPYPKAQVTLNAVDIKSLSIIEVAQLEEPVDRSGGGEGRRRRQPRATVCESLQASQGSEGNGTNIPCSTAAVAGIDAFRCIAATAGSVASRTTASMAGGKDSVPLKGKGYGGYPAHRGGALRRRDEAAFGAECELGDGEFDFEGNLALFDKAAVRARPDVVPCARAYRPDQPVLRPGPPRAPIAVPPALQGAHSYVTDGGVRVPTACVALRERLWTAMREHDLLDDALVLLARGAADVTLRLLGGGRRLEPRNAHQTPRVAALAGPGRAGRAALIAARLLASHGVGVVCCCDGDASLARELAALRAADVPVVVAPAALPAAGLDAVVVGLGEDRPALVAWASSGRAPVVALEPPPRGWGASLQPRASVLGLLPLALPPSLGRVYLALVAPPPRLMAAHAVTYSPPFGASPLIALHPADD